VYGPRTITNDESMMNAGGWASIVDLRTGAVTSLGRGYTMAYFNPGCGAGNEVALSAFDGGKTRVTLLDTSTMSSKLAVAIAGQYTSAIPDEKGGLVAIGAEGVVRLNSNNSVSRIAAVGGNGYDLTANPAGQLTYLVSSGDTATALAVDPQASSSRPRTVATGSLTGTGIARDGAGTVSVLTSGGLTVFDKSISVVKAPAGSKLSSAGRLAIASSRVDVPVGGSADPHSVVKIAAVSTVTGEQFEFGFSKTDGPNSASSALPEIARPSSSESQTLGAATASVALLAGSSTDPVESERVCSIPRNDPTNQVLQPKPRQVEWAVDMAVQGHLTTTSAGNLSNLGNAAFSPQGMFPAHALAGGGHVPAQIVLGVLAQESNLWQADRFTYPGTTGNPLIGDFYGTRASGIDWTIDFTNADCGYGVGQITDGMRLPGKEAPGDPVALPADQQRAIALDYSANIAKVVQMLDDKWNQVANAGMTLNGGTSAGLEDWFFAVWAYNTGFHVQAGSAPWGVGWSNNPVNPIYNPARGAFLENSPSDAAHPQDWPYPEKVMGFAAWSLTVPESIEVQAGAHPTGYTETDVTGYNIAGWSSNQNRTAVKPPTTTFCTVAGNQCNPATTAKCTRADSECWWHSSVSWKTCNSSCGAENIRFDYPMYAAPQADGASLLGRCNSGGLPSGSLVVDDVTTAPRRAGCAQQPNSGSFGFTFFQPNASGSYAAKIDLHQQGGGFNDHFYFSHVRSVAPGDRTETSGMWTLGQALTQWTQVYIHIPSYGAWSGQAAYKVNVGDGTGETRTINQRRFANEWVSLGVFKMNGTPTITLTNLANYGQDYVDIAWDAVAFRPLSAKPRDFVVSLGDSFSSGEGASDLSTGASYTPESDHDGSDSGTISLRNGCHRSAESWPRKTILLGATTTVGSRADTFDSTLDYHVEACSAAVTSNVLSSPTYAQYGQLSQIDQGYLDANTTLVTISIGGNDMRFSDILQACVGSYAAVVLGAPYSACNLQTLTGDTTNLATATTNRLTNALPGLLDSVLTQIHLKAPNAKIVLMGYPKLFETGDSCVFMNEADRPWLNTVSAGLGTAMASAATRAVSRGIAVKFEDPQPFFASHNLCTSPSAENGLVFQQTPGDKAMYSLPVPGPNFGVGVSQQSIHPNTLGTTDYAAALQDALSGFYP